MRILFLHGWNSVPGGVKPPYLKDHGHEVINPALPHEDFAEAVRIAQAECDKHRPQVVVGSSRGGAVAMNINSGDARLVLLCPAWKKYGTAKMLKAGSVILHSRADDVVPFADSEELIRHSGLPDSALLEVGSDHRLADPEPLAAMLRATHTPWSAAVDRSSNAAALELSSDTAVMAIGGFSGTDPVPTLQQFKSDVAAHRVSYYVSANTIGRGPGRTPRSHADIARWVAANFPAVQVGKTLVWDLSTPTESARQVP